MIAAVTAGLCVGDVVPLLNDSHIFALAHHFNDLGNVLHKLTKDTDARNILNFFFNSIRRNLFSARFFQYAGRTFQPPRYGVNGRINAQLSAFFVQTAKL